MAYSKNSKPITPRVVIADDHRIFRQILALTLEEAGMEVVQMATTGREAVEATLKHKPDIVLMDIVMPEMDGLAALSVIKFNCPETPVFMITALADPLYFARAGELGAEGFFSKTVRSNELVSAIRDILSVETLPLQAQGKSEQFNPLAAGIPIPKTESQSPRKIDLTEQERLILSFIATGLDNRSVMERLHITKNTIKTHVRNIFTKLGVSDRTQAAIWAIQHGYDLELSAESKGSY